MKPEYDFTEGKRFTHPVWAEMTGYDIPDFIECLKKYPLALDDPIKENPFTHYHIRVNAPDAYYGLVPDMGYLALDPIGPQDAVIHIVRDPRYRHPKKKYLDITKAFMLWAFGQYHLHRITLCVTDGAKDAFVLAKALGFTLEGSIRESRVVNGMYLDTHIFGILKGEIKWLQPYLS